MHIWLQGASKPTWVQCFATLTQHCNPEHYACSHACAQLCLAAAVPWPQHQATHAAAAVPQQTCVQLITQGVPSFHALSSRSLCQRFRHRTFIHTPTNQSYDVTACTAPSIPSSCCKTSVTSNVLFVCQDSAPASCQQLSSASPALCGLLLRSAAQLLTNPACLAAGHRHLRPSSGHQKLSPVMHTHLVVDIAEMATGSVS